MRACDKIKIYNVLDITHHQIHPLLNRRPFDRPRDGQFFSTVRGWLVGGSRLTGFSQLESAEYRDRNKLPPQSRGLCISIVFGGKQFLFTSPQIVFHLRPRLEHYFTVDISKASAHIKQSSTCFKVIITTRKCTIKPTQKKGMML